MKYLFVYGSLITEKSPFNLKPLESVFIQGFKLYLEKKENTKTNYHFIKLQKTSNLEDIVSGYLVEFDEKTLEKLDAYEGNSYERIETEAVKRNLEKVKVFIYM
jgi:gamma-glutamylcyclotransferase (GGCT)/AIG2-like uncharacterized protein YtfP